MCDSADPGGPDVQESPSYTPPAPPLPQQQQAALLAPWSNVINALSLTSAHMTPKTKKIPKKPLLRDAS